MVENIDVVLPVRNEAESIIYTLESIQGQQFKGKYHYRVRVIANGCDDLTGEVAKETIKRLTTSQLKDEVQYEVIIKKQPGKVAAINHALNLSNTKIFMCIDGDTIFSERCFDNVADTMHEQGIIVSGAAPWNIIANDTDTEVVKCQSISNLLQKINESNGLLQSPVGAMLAFQRKLLDEIPLGIFAEDSYIRLLALLRYGMKSVRTSKDAEVYQIAPRNYDEYIERSRRIGAMDYDVLAKYPEFKHLFKNYLKKFPSGKVADALLIPRLKSINVDMNDLKKWNLVQSQFDIAWDVKKFLLPDGTWKPAASTKRSAEMSFKDEVTDNLGKNEDFMLSPSVDLNTV